MTTPTLDELRLPVQLVRRLATAGISTVPELCAWSVDELRARPGFGPTRLSEVRRALAEHGQRLRGDEAPSSPPVDWSNTPEALRGSKKVGWRLAPKSIKTVKAFAAELHEGEGLVAEAMLAVAAEHPDEVRAMLERLREGVGKKSTEP